MEKPLLSAKQKKAILHGPQQHDDRHILVANGTVRSGKTFACTAGFVAYTQGLDEPQKHLLCGRKLGVLTAEVLPQMESMAEHWEAPFHHDRYDDIVTIGQQSYHMFGGNDESSAGRIQGLTIHSAFMNEATLVPESFFDMATSRLTFDDSRMWVDCNPAGPLHWLKKKWIDEQKVRTMDFFFEDNPTLTAKVVARLKAQYSGVFAKRMIQGLWAAAEGLIWDTWKEVKLDWSRYQVMRTVIGSDYGSASPSAFVKLHRLRDRITRRILYHVSQVVRVEGTQAHTKTDTELADILMLMADTSEHKPNALIVDPSAASFKAELRKRRKFPVRDAKNDVIPGLRRTGALLANTTTTIDPDCEPLLDEMASYSWDPKKEDEPLKENDHCCDAFRYATMDMGDMPQETIAIPEGM